MEYVIWIGAVVALIGIAGLCYCIMAVARAKGENLDDEAMRARIRSVMPLNLGALFVAAIGLMMVVVGILLR